MTQTLIVDINNISFSYAQAAILQGVNLQIKNGDFIAMIGPNGGGKTTLVKLILGLLKPDKGTITVMGKSASKASSYIGYVPQNVNINQNFPITALDVVLMGKLNPRQRWRKTTGTDYSDAMEALDRLGMADDAERKIGELSGGQRQRVFISRALVTNPTLLLLDEPTTNIDTKGQTDFYNLLKELNNDITILVVSHDLLVISKYVKSVVCVNKDIHHHNQNEILGDMLKSMYSCSVEEICPVGIMSGMPLRTPQKVMEKK